MRKISHRQWNSPHLASVSQASGQNWLSSFCQELMGSDGPQQGDSFHPERDVEQAQNESLAAGVSCSLFPLTIER